MSRQMMPTNLWH